MPCTPIVSNRVSALLLIALVTTAMFAARLTARSSHPGYWTPVTSEEVETTLLQIGITPETLAAAGVGSAPSIDSVIQGMWTALEANISNFRQIEEARRTHTIECIRLERLVRAGQASEQEVEACEAEREAAMNASLAAQSFLDTLFQEATASLPEHQRTMLVSMRSSRPHTASIPFGTIELDARAWIALRRALADERIAERLNEEPNGELQAQLAQLRADPTVSLASANLAAHSGPVTAVWDIAFGR